MGRCRRASRGSRRAQCASVGAGPHRHHQLHDGLRHHRHRTRPFASQDEEARRRRNDDHHQPDRAPCAALARLQRKRDRRNHRAHPRAQRNPQRPSHPSRTPRSFRLLLRRRRHLSGRAHRHDGSRPAFPERRHLQDCKPARSHHRRRHRASALAGLGKRRESGGDLSGELQSGATALGWFKGASRRIGTD